MFTGQKNDISDIGKKWIWIILGFCFLDNPTLDLVTAEQFHDKWHIQVKYEIKVSVEVQMIDLISLFHESRCESWYINMANIWIW